MLQLLVEEELELLKLLSKDETETDLLVSKLYYVEKTALVQAGFETLTEAGYDQ